MCGGWEGNKHIPFKLMRGCTLGRWMLWSRCLRSGSAQQMNNIISPRWCVQVSYYSSRCAVLKFPHISFSNACAANLGRWGHIPKWIMWALNGFYLLYPAIALRSIFAVAVFLLIFTWLQLKNPVANFFGLNAVHVMCASNISACLSPRFTCRRSCVSLQLIWSSREISLFFSFSGVNNIPRAGERAYQEANRKGRESDRSLCDR